MTDLAELLDALIPPAAGLPGAREAGVAERLEQTFTTCPTLALPARRALATLLPEGVWRIERPGAVESAKRPPEEALAALERADPEGFAALAELVAVTWATAPAVRAALGHDPDAPLDLAGLTAGEQLLAPVLARGPRWKGHP